MKRPAFQFYPADWRKDVELQSCSMAAQGLWINAMCVAHECEPYGYLTVNGKAMSDAQLGRQVGLSAKECGSLLVELLEAGVARKSDEGAIYSKRMVDDERIRSARAAGGKEGAEHGAKGGEHGVKGGRPKKDKGGFKTPLPTDKEPPPSSSSSSSTSVDSEAEASGAAAPPPMEPAEIIFGYGLPLLTNAGTPEKQARTFLGALRKRPGGDAAVVNALRDCLKAKPLQPLEWLAAALPPDGAKAGKHSGFQDKNYREGIEADGSFV